MRRKSSPAGRPSRDFRQRALSGRPLVRLGLVLAATASALGAVSSAGAAGASPDLSSVTLKVATYPLEGDEVLLKAAGLTDTPYTVQYQYLSSGALQSQAVDDGTADIGRASGISNALLAAAGPVHFKSVATLKIGVETQDTLVLKSSGITSVKQLKGKKVGYIPNTTPQYFLLKQLQAAGLSWSDITPVSFTEPTTGLAALISGSVSALATFGNVTTAETQGATILSSGGPYLKGDLGALQGTYNAYTPDLSDPAKSAAIADFIARVDTAMAWARSHPKQYAQIVANNTNQPLATELTTFEGEESSVNTWVGPNSAAAVNNEKEYAAAFVAAGSISGPVNVAATFSDKLSKAIAADEASYHKKYKSYFVVPAYAKPGESSNGQGSSGS
jgi:sulfonate transport system substrate-binding protein